MYQRGAMGRVTAALADTPVVLVHGARQTGKSTLARQLSAARPARRYLTLDEPAVLGAATADPAGFLAGLEGPIVLDEVQRAPGLFAAIKAEVDRDRRPGRYLLTGSANVLLLPRLSESLAGRIEIVPLWPLAQSEIEGTGGRFVDSLFAARLPAGPFPGQRPADLLARILRGGFPEPLARADPGRRAAWFESYIGAILQRDVRDMANIQGLTELPRLLRLLASRTAGLLNYSDLSRSLSIPHSTLKRYFALLEATFLAVLIPPWSANLGLRLIKSPKVMLADTGLGAHLLALDPESLRHDGGALGALLENFAALEILKQLTWSRARAALHFFRTAAGQEVDLVLENSAGHLVGIEVKAAATVHESDFRALRLLAEGAGARFKRGIVLYTGREAVPFGPALVALPISALWSL